MSHLPIVGTAVDVPFPNLHSFLETSINKSDINKSAESDGYLPCDNSSTSGVNTSETHGHEDRVEDIGRFQQCYIVCYWKIDIFYMVPK
jgi:hypothetical protein